MRKFATLFIGALISLLFTLPAFSAPIGADGGDRAVMWIKATVSYALDAEVADAAWPDFHPDKAAVGAGVPNTVPEPENGTAAGWRELPERLGWSVIAVASCLAAQPPPDGRA